MLIVEPQGVIKHWLCDQIGYIPTAEFICIGQFDEKKQDLRIDLPTIGLNTIKQSKTAGLKGIVIKSKQHVFLDKTKCIKFANKNKMFISVK